MPEGRRPPWSKGQWVFSPDAPSPGSATSPSTLSVPISATSSRLQLVTAPQDKFDSRTLEDFFFFPKGAYSRTGTSSRLECLTLDGIRSDGPTVPCRDIPQSTTHGLTAGGLTADGPTSHQFGGWSSTQKTRMARRALVSGLIARQLDSMIIFGPTAQWYTQSTAQRSMA